MSCIAEQWRRRTKRHETKQERNTARLSKCVSHLHLYKRCLLIPELSAQSLAAFLKKRDPRFLRSATNDPMKARVQDMERTKADLRQAAMDRAIQRQKEAEAYAASVPDWQKAKTGHRQGRDAAEEDFSEDEEGFSGAEEEDNGWYCAACDKTFLSQGGWDNHEVCLQNTIMFRKCLVLKTVCACVREQRSKKHIKTVQQLKKQMLAEDAEFSLQAEPVQPEAASEDEAGEAPVASTSRSASPSNRPASAQPDSDSDSEADAPQRQTQSSKKARKKAKREEQEQKKLAQQMQESTLAEGEATAVGGEEQMSKKDKRRAREKAKAESTKENEKQVRFDFSGLCKCVC